MQSVMILKGVPSFLHVSHKFSGSLLVNRDNFPPPTSFPRVCCRVMPDLKDQSIVRGRSLRSSLPPSDRLTSHKPARVRHREPIDYTKAPL
ncbi:hypothetical protein PAXRUDRAFT_664059 [Paxillus rubicundulus Ve08.2h10]|uniref:Uncharacterized protein n=1 Tax=Paxillus rubicundulus Ve08.2h10 TaxID=930991 RepID=A0A0D0EC17_9AGAM|nr:hypothetical protein PAXRUDRAFT_664059 [Paxillus rubicundulus Ve08.2h10]